jgi:hypothetical protein
MLQPGGFIGTYSLHRANNLLLPYTILAAPSGCAWTVSSGTLTLGKDAFVLGVEEPVICNGPFAGSTLTPSLSGGVTITGPRSLVLHFVANPNGSTVDLPVSLDDSTVTVPVTLGPIGSQASVALMFGGRSTGFFFPTVSQPN